MCAFEIQTIVAKATVPAKSEFLSSQRIFHPLLILQVVSTSLKLRLLLASLRCRRCLLTPCNEISMWKKCSGTPGIDPYQNFQSIASIKLIQSIVFNKLNQSIVFNKLNQSIVFNKLNQSIVFNKLNQSIVFNKLNQSIVFNKLSRRVRVVMY